MSRIHPSVLAIAALSAVTAVAACSSSGGGSGSTPSSTSTAPTSAQPTAVVTTSPTSSAPAEPTGATTSSDGSGSGSTSGSACAESQLRASVTSQDLSSIGYHVVRLVFTNTSSSTCTLTGYPGAAIVDDSGKQVQQAKRVTGGPVAGTVEKVGTVPVAPGKSVFAYLEGKSTREQGAAQAGCDAPKYPKILVTPPNTRTSVPFTIGWPQCESFNVHPVRTQ